MVGGSRENMASWEDISFPSPSMLNKRKSMDASMFAKIGIIKEVQDDESIYRKQSSIETHKRSSSLKVSGSSFLSSPFSRRKNFSENNIVSESPKFSRSRSFSKKLASVPQISLDYSDAASIYKSTEEVLSTDQLNEGVSLT